MRRCAACGVEKSTDEFSPKGPSRPGQLVSYCKPCNSFKVNEHRKANREKHNAYMRKWRAKNRDRVNDNAAKRRYPGFDRDEALEAQGGCAICGTTDPGKRGWAVDHDHSCCEEGKNRTCGECVRGVLCHSCNVGIGHLRDDPEILSRAIEYLTRANSPA